MNKKTEELLKKVNDKKQEVKDLVNQNKIEEAKKAKEELVKLSDEFNIVYDLEQGKEEKVKDSILNGGRGISINNKKHNINLINKNDSFYKSIIKNSENEDLSIGKYVKGMLTGDWKNATSEMESYRALTTSTGKTVIPQELSAQIIDLARPQMALGDIPILPMKSNNITIARIEKDPEIKFKEELKKAEFSDMTFGAVELKSRTIYGLMKISLELLNSANNIDQVIQQAMANAIAQSIDTVGLYGDGELQPKGILTYDDINIISSEGIDKSKYISLVKGIGAITKANGVPTTISYNSNIDTSLSLLTDTTGQPLNMPKKVEDLQHKVSNNIKDNQAMVYDNNSIVMGLQNKIIIDTSSDMGFEDGSVWLRVYAMLDFAVLKPKNVTRIDYTV